MGLLLLLGPKGLPGPLGLLGPVGVLGQRRAHVAGVVALRHQLQRKDLELPAELPRDGTGGVKDFRLGQVRIEQALLLRNLAHVNLTMLKLLIGCLFDSLVGWFDVVVVVCLICWLVGLICLLFA